MGDTPEKVFDESSFEDNLRAQVTYWQKILYLQDWNIEVQASRHWEMPSLTLAQCEFYLNRKDAIIRLLHPTDITGLAHRFVGGEESDYDISIVHELLHLHFAPFSTNIKHIEIAQEQAINAISRSLVKLYRNPPESKETITPTDSGGHYL